MKGTRPSPQRGTLIVALVALCACLLAAACNDEQNPEPTPSPTAAAASPEPTAWEASLHLSRSRFYSTGSDRSHRLSYRIDPTTGRLTYFASDEEMLGFSPDPLGRHVYTLDTQQLQSYSYDWASGRCSHLDTQPLSAAGPGVAGQACEPAASYRHVYVSCSTRGSTRTYYHLASYSVSEGGRLALVTSSEFLGNDLEAGRTVVPDPDGKFVYLMAGGRYADQQTMVARSIKTDGTLTQAAILRFPGTHEITGFLKVGNALLVGLGGLATNGGYGMAVVFFDKQRSMLELRHIVEWPDTWEGPSLLQVGEDAFITVQGSEVKLYSVGPTGDVEDRGVVPDPQGYYTKELRMITFHPSYRFAYLARRASILTLDVAPDGQLTPIEELPLPDDSTRYGSNRPVIIARPLP